MKLNNLKTFLNNYLALSKRELKSGNVAEARILIDEFNIVNNKNLDLERQVRELQVLNKDLRSSLSLLSIKNTRISDAIESNSFDMDSVTVDKIKAVLNGNG